MEDVKIIELFFERDERALSETELKYGDRCNSLAFRILNSKEDSEEAVNDALMKAWNTIPPNNPSSLFSYLAMLCRQISIDKLRKSTSKKRGLGEYELSIEELESCIPNELRQTEIENDLLKDTLNSFLSKLPKKKRVIFMSRYWAFYSISEIAENLNMSEGSVKMTLLRTREKLRDFMEKEGVDI